MSNSTENQNLTDSTSSYTTTEETQPTTENIVTTTGETSTSGPNTDPNYFVVYIALGATILALIEMVIIVVFVIRCCCSKRNKKKKETVHQSIEDGIENPVFSVVNRSYTGPDSLDSGSIDTNKPTSIQSANDGGNIGMIEMKKSPRYDPGYMDFGMNVNGTPDQEEICKRAKSNEPKVSNKTYSHIEVKPRYLSSVDRSEYAELKDGKNERTSDKRSGARPQQDFSQTIHSNDDTEYDHAVSRKSYQTFFDKATYSRLSSVVPKQVSSFRVAVSETEATNTDYEDIKVNKVCLATSGGTIETGSLENAKEGCQAPERANSRSVLESSEPYIYSTVHKAKTVYVQNDNETKQTLHNTLPSKTGSSFQNANDLQSEKRNEMSQDDKESKSVSNDFEQHDQPRNKMSQKAKRPIIQRKSQKCLEYSRDIKKLADIKETPQVEKVPVDKKSEKNCEFSGDIKKSVDTKETSRVENGTEDMKAFCVAGDQDLPDPSDNKKHEYINITRQNTV